MHRVLVAGISLALLTPLGVLAQDFQFMPPRQRTTSLLPARVFQGHVAVDDFNGDGRPDVAATHLFDWGSHRLGVFAGSPTGSFTPLSQLPGDGQRLVLVDLDRDGDRDLLLVPPELPSQRPIVLYENTPGGLQPVALPAGLAGVLVQGAAPGDIDGDGFIDLVIAVPPGSLVPSIVLARGGPGLQFTVDLTSIPAGLPLGLWPALLDADGDGDLDVLASNAASGLRLLRNNGGTFVDATATLPATTPGQTFLLAVDLDRDGRPDCATVNDTGLIDVLWGAASGLASGPGIATVPTARSLSPADFDFDGDLDLLVDHGNGLDVLWQQGNRQFARAELVRGRPALFGTGDVDGDLGEDVVFTDPDEDFFVRCKYRARFEDAGLALGVPMPPDEGTLGAFVSSTPGDVDGDGRTDVVTIGTLATAVDHALVGGAYRQSTSATFAVGLGGPARSELADIDGDGDLDLVVRTSVELAIGTNDGNGAFTSSVRIPGMRSVTSSIVDGLRIADIDRDGDLDIVMTDDRGAVLVRNLGGAQYAAPVVVVPPTPAPTCIEVTDVDGDGDLDVISSALAASGLTHVIVANDGAGGFAPDPAFSLHLGQYPRIISAGDLDGDGDADLVVADDRLLVYRNDGRGSFADTTLFDLPPGQRVLVINPVVSDFDEDGDLDIAAVGFGGWMLLLNDGSGRFTDQAVTRVDPLAVADGFARAQDVDDDGDVDLWFTRTGGSLRTVKNHLRQCRSAVLPRLGGVADLHLISGPNFGAPGLGLLGVGFAVAPAPLQLPGLAGQLELDPATMQVMAAVTTSSIGVSSAFVPVPQDAVLFGLDVWFQGAILPSVGQPGFTNAVYEVVLR